ncbi:MAG: trypsin-like peptidase domain-containing protein [Candidatus Shapirobacteria bacterium]
MFKLKRFLIALAIGIFVLAALLGRAAWLKQPSTTIITNQRVLTEESVIIEVAEKASPGVVTVGVTKNQPVFDPFGAGLFQEEVKQDIGSGFVVDKEGLIVTNKHVVEDTQAKYRVITKDDKEYEVKKIYRDPINDLAILKIEPHGEGLVPIEMGDSDKLKVGQYAIAIGTALGEFRHTVTVGVVSGLGRGITAGSLYESSAEKLDNVIQTDAAINPGNSGGPLLNSAGQVIGVNVAMAVSGQSIGFALPINVVKETLKNFESTGKFERAFLGVRYQMITRDLALMNKLPQGAYVREVVAASPADRAGVKKGDIIVKFKESDLRKNEGDLAKLISQSKVGEWVKIVVWREEGEVELTVTLDQAD